MADVITRLKVESSEYDSKIKRAAQSLNEMTTAAEREGSKIATANKENIALAQSLGKMATVSSNTRGKMNELTAAIEAATIQYNRLSAAEKQGQFGKALNTSIGQLQTRLAGLKTEMAAVQSQMGKTSMAGGMGGFASGIKSGMSMFGPTAAGMMAVTAAAGAMTKVFSDLITLNKDFEQQNANLAAVMGKSRSEITALTDQAKELGATTQYTASQITELQTNLARLGFDETEILNSTKSVQALATATGADLGEAANLAGAALRAFGLDSSEMERVASVLAVSTTKSALSFEKLATAVPIVSPVAKQFGFEIEDVVTLLGKLSDAGFDASSAATASRNIFLNMANSSGKLAQALGRPIERIEDFAPALMELKERGIDLAEMLDLTDKRSVAAFATFVETAGTMEKFKQEVTGCSDALQAMVDEQLNTLQGSITILNSAWEGLMLAFGDSINGPLKGVVDSTTAVIGKLTEMKKSGELAKIFGTVRVSVEAAAAAFVVYKAATEAATIKTTFINAINSATKAIRAMNAAMLSNPYAAVAAAIAAVTVAIVGYIRVSKEAAKAAREYSSAAEAQKKANEKTQASTSEVISSYSRLKTEWQGLSTAQEKATWINNNKTAFENLGLSINNAVDADNAFVQSSEKVIAALKARAKANALQGLYEEQIRGAYERATEEAQKRKHADVSAGTYIATDNTQESMDRMREMGLTGKDDAVKHQVYQGAKGYATKFALTEQGAEKVNAYYAQKASEDAQELTNQYVAQVEKIYGDMYKAAIKEANEAEVELGKLGKFGDVKTGKGGDKPLDKKAIATLRAKYEAEEKEDIAHLDRMSMAEEDYEAKVYEIKKANLERIAKLYNEDSKEYAQVMAKKSQLDIQYQGTQMRLANKTNKGTGSTSKPKEEYTGIGEYSQKAVSARISHAKTVMDSSEFGSDRYLYEADKLVDLTTFQNLLKEATTVGMTIDPERMKEWLQGIDMSLGVSDESWQKMVDEINEKRAALDLPPIELDVKTGNVEKLDKQVGSLEQNLTGAINVFGQLGDAMQQIDDPGAKVAGIIMGAIANIAGTFAASLKGTFTPWDWIAAAISGTATMISTIAAIKSATSGSYASGGIIPGNSYSGDNLTANVNSGELILNRSQQDSIAGQLQNSNPMANISIEGKISGTDILLAANNSNRSRGGSRSYYAKVH